MGLTMDRFDAVVAKSKDPRMTQKAQFNVRYPTGFLNFDFLNGTVVHVKDRKTQKEIGKYNSIGILDGSIVFFVGRSGCGKTTLALQMAANIIRPFPNGEIYHEDIEGGVADERKYQLMHMTPEEAETRYKQRNAGITSENFFERMKILHDNRLEVRDQLTYDTGYVDMEGNKIYKLEPVVVILDSLAMMMPESVSEEDGIAGGMSATHNAKVNAQIFRRLVPMLKMANIILFVVNHITDDPSIRPKKPQLAFLKIGEALPGGKEAVYAATNILRIDDAEKLKPDEGLKINGMIADVSLVKARSSFNGRMTKMVLNYDTGFDPELSLFIMLKENKLLNGSAVYPYFGDREDLKFTQATFRTKLEANSELQEVFAIECFKYLQTIISDPEISEARADLSNSIQNRIFGMMQVPMLS
jgi:RecA/RadA recombinase